MTQRARISGHQLKASPSQHVGMLNAEKCVIYLRGVGVEIDDATADSWLDIQATHRFLASEKKAWRTVWTWTCSCGEMVGHLEHGRGRMRIKRDKGERRPPPKCEKCGSGFVAGSRTFDVLRDGTIRDYRRGVNRVVPLRLDEWAGGI